MTRDGEGAPGGPAQTFEILTLFPDVVRDFVVAGLLGKACERGLVDVRCIDIREFTEDKHRTVDDAPFGGGPGMVMKVEPIVAALESVEAERGPTHRILLTPSGTRFDQEVARRLSRHPRIALVCGRYEGIDDRVREHFVDECLSLGDFVLNGGEVAALAIVEAVARLHEGVLGNPESLVGESFTDPLLEAPQYTRPASFRGHDVPAVLLGGNHADIEAWRRAQALARTWDVRPDLRPPPRLSADVPVYLGFSGAPPDDLARLADVVRHHGVTGVVAIGVGLQAHVLEWARAAEGRLQVAAFNGVSALRRRLRRSHGGEPRLVAVSAHAGDEALTDPRVVIELVAAKSAQPAALVLLVGATEDCDVVYAPIAQASDRPGTLALRDAIEDAPQPRTADPVGLADLALATLRG